MTVEKRRIKSASRQERWSRLVRFKGRLRVALDNRDLVLRKRRTARDLGQQVQRSRGAFGENVRSNQDTVHRGAGAQVAPGQLNLFRDLPGTPRLRALRYGCGEQVGDAGKIARIRVIAPVHRE